MIALRTRSKLPLKDTPIDEIEADFVAPDATPDMYDMPDLQEMCDSDKDAWDWQLFLSDLYKESEA